MKLFSLLLLFVYITMTIGITIHNVNAVVTTTSRNLKTTATAHPIRRASQGPSRPPTAKRRTFAPTHPTTPRPTAKTTQTHKPTKFLKKTNGPTTSAPTPKIQTDNPTTSSPTPQTFEQQFFFTGQIQQVIVPFTGNYQFDGCISCCC
jgi:hypothetical protein